MMSMTSDVIDIDELNTGKRREGSLGAIYWWMVKFGTAVAGLLSGLIRSPLLDTNLFRFIKVDLDLSTKYTFKKTAIALRFFAGVGYALDQTRNPVNRFNLPLYRQYFAGGPNSMRAWGLRKLGPGSSIQEYGNRGLPERYGDLQLEGNADVFDHHRQ